MGMVNLPSPMGLAKCRETTYMTPPKHWHFSTTTSSQRKIACKSSFLRSYKPLFSIDKGRCSQEGKKICFFGAPLPHNMDITTGTGQKAQKNSLPRPFHLPKVQILSCCKRMAHQDCLYLWKLSSVTAY